MPEITDPLLLAELNGPQGAPQFPRSITIGRPNPNKQIKDALDIRKAQGDLAREPYELEAMRAKGQRDALEIQELQAKIARGGMTPDDAVKIQQKQANLDSLVDQINRTQQLFNETQAPDNFGGLTEYLPTPANAQFDAAAAGLAEQGLGAFRVPGVGAQSDAELRQFVQANKPSSYSFDEANLERMRQLRNRVDQTRQELGLSPAQWTGIQDQDQQIASGVQSPPQGGNPPGGGIQGFNASAGGPTGPAPTGGGFRDIPIQKAMQDEINSRLKAFPRGRLTPEAYQAIRSEVDAKYGFGQYNPDPQATADYIENYNDLKRPVNRKIPPARVPESQFQERDTVGGGIGAGFNSALDAFTLGNGQSIRAGLSSLNPFSDTTYEQNLTGAAITDQIDSEVNPNYQFGGQVAGGVAGTALVGKGLGGLSRGLSRAAPRLGRPAASFLNNPTTANVAYGAGYGASTADEGEGLQGAAGGAAAALGGDVIGRGLSRAIAPAGNVAARYLQGAGVPMTIGQILRGNSGRVSRAVSGVEDVAANTPVVGALVNPRRTESLEGFNRAAFNEGLDPIGGQVDNIGAGGLQQFRQLNNRAYDEALSPVNLAPDEQFATGFRGAIDQGASIPRLGPEFADFIGKNVRPIAGDSETISGQQFQDILRTLRARRSKYAASGDPVGEDVAGALTGVEDQFTNLLSRQAPDAMTGFNAANQAYGNRKVLEQAIGSAKNQLNDGNEIFTPAQLNTASFNNRARYGGKSASAEGNRPFYELAKAGQEILPNKIPPTGVNAAPAIAGLSAIGAGSGISPALIIPALGAGAYTAFGRDVIQRMMLGQRPEMIEKFAPQIRKYGGIIGAGAMVPLAAPQ